MSKLSKADMEELREYLSFGCEYSGTKDSVKDLTTEVLIELGTKNYYGDEIGLTDANHEFACLDEFVERFWDKVVDTIMNVVETQ